MQNLLSSRLVRGVLTLTVSLEKENLSGRNPVSQRLLWWGQYAASLQPGMRSSLLLFPLLLGVAAASAVYKVLYLGEGDVCKDLPKKWYCKSEERCPGSDQALKDGWIPEVCTYKKNRKMVLCCPPNQEDYFAGTQQLSSWNGWNLPSKGGWNLDKPPAKPPAVAAKPSAPAKPSDPKAPANKTTPGSPTLLSKEPEKNPVLISSPPQQNTDTNRAIAKANEMCKQYVKHLYRKEGIITFVGAEENIKAFCGRSGKPLVFGGEDAKPYEFPHMARIGYGEEGNIEWGCGGSLISERFILSAAHCSIVLDRYARWANLGDCDLKTERDVPASEVVTVKIAEIFDHPGYKRGESWYNDIALFKLEKDLNLGIYVRPACLNTKATLTNNSVVISGWGLTKPPLHSFPSDNPEDSGYPTVLQKVELNVVSRDKCNATYSALSARDRTYIQNGIKEKMLCAGGIPGKAVCNADSGGPLQTLAPECMYDIVGVTSFGYGCKSEVPGVYTNVIDYVPWIVTIVWGNK